MSHANRVCNDELSISNANLYSIDFFMLKTKTIILLNPIILKNNRICTHKPNNLLLKHLSEKIKVKKRTYPLANCFLINKKNSTYLPTKKNITSKRIYYKNYFNSLNTKINKINLSNNNNNNNISSLLKNKFFLYQQSWNFLVINYIENSKNNALINRHIVEKNRSAPPLQMISSLSIRKYLLQTLKNYQGYFLDYASIVRSKIKKRPRKLINPKINSTYSLEILSNNAKYKNKYIPSENKSIKKNNLFIGNVYNKKTILLHNIKKIILTEKINIKKLQQQYASTLMKNIFHLRKIKKEEHYSENFISRVQKKKNNKYIKLDNRLSNIELMLENLVQTNKQNEMNNLAFNLFNEKRKKTYSDFL